MKLTTVIVAMATMVGGAWGQNPDAIDNARSVAKTLQQQQATDTKAPAAKPAPGAPAPAVKPAAIPGQTTAPIAPAAPAEPMAKAAAPKPEASAKHNQLQHVSVVPGTNDIQIEISSSGAVTPKVTKLSSPARVLVELPETAVATSQTKIPVGSSGVKAVRIGMDGKTPPTTSVVVDLEKALSYDVAPGTAGKVVLILHTQDAGTAVAKNVSAPVAKAPTAASAAAAQTQVAGKTSAASVKPVATAKGAEGKATAAKPVAAPAVAASNTPAAKPVTKADSKQAAKTVVAAKASPVAVAMPAVTAKPAAAPKPKEEKKWAMTGKRDPFFSPVVQEHGSGCSTGKKCLEIGTINLRGVVKSDSGFIAVVTNNLNKAYFLRENDPVFNGYVVKITGDSVTFQETIQDKLGKSFTREVVKRIFTPAV
jgi:Tfp pilus assembly protein PilP